MLVACEPPPNEPIPATDALRTIQGTSWLVRRVTFGEPQYDRSNRRRGAVAGYDIDHRDVEDGDSIADCVERTIDNVSELDYGITGVDNAGATMILLGETFAPTTTFQDALDDAMRDGRIRWAVRVGELDEDQTSLALELFLVEPTEPLVLDAGGTPAPGQRLRAHRVAQTRGPVRRHVAWGWVEPTELPGTGDVYLLPFDDFRLTAFGVAAEHAQELRGNLGGWFTVDGVTTITADVTGFDRETVLGSVEGHGDLGPSAADPWTCERISVGFGFEAVPVELVTE